MFVQTSVWRGPITTLPIRKGTTIMNVHQNKSILYIIWKIPFYIESLNNLFVLKYRIILILRNFIIPGTILIIYCYLFGSFFHRGNYYFYRYARRLSYFFKYFERITNLVVDSNVPIISSEFVFVFHFDLRKLKEERVRVRTAHITRYK